MSILEAPPSTWEKRFQQRHYSYRDFQTATTSPQPTTAAAVAAQTYIFGTNARAISPLTGLVNVDAWPNIGDWLLAGQCYARQVEILCTVNAWISIVSINPHFTTLLIQGYSAAQLAALGVSQTIIERPQFIPAGDYKTFFPTLGASIIFWHAIAQGTIYIWIEGNVEGTE